MVIMGCGGCGISIAGHYRREAQLLTQLIRALQYMEWELQYQLTPLPELCRQAGNTTGGVLRRVFWNLARELDAREEPDVYSCMKLAMKGQDLPENLQKHLIQLGCGLGRFDFAAQLQELRAVRTSCREELKEFRKNRDIRLRNYQTLGFCAGAALAILFA